MKNIFYRTIALALLPVTLPLFVASHLFRCSRYNRLPVCCKCGWKHHPEKQSCIPVAPPKY